MTGDGSVGVGDATLGGVVGRPPAERHESVLAPRDIRLLALAISAMIGRPDGEPSALGGVGHGCS